MKKITCKAITALGTAAVMACMSLVPVMAADKYVISTDTTFPPFEFTNADNEFVGIDVDILDAIAKDQGFEYELNSLGFDAALLAVQSGQADGVIAGMSITDERKEKFDFSEPYYDADVTMAVAAGSDIASYEDLKGQKVAVKTATNGADYAKSIAEEYEFEIVEFKDSPTMYQDVQLGNTVACFEDYPVMAYNIQQGAPMEIPEGMTAAGSSYGFAVNKGQNAELLEMFNTGLKNIMDNGTYDEIVAKYTQKDSEEADNAEEEAVEEQEETLEEAVEAEEEE